MSRNSRLINATLIVVISVASMARGQFDLSWHTIDGGGGDSAGGTLTLTAAIGQPDAQTPLSGGAFQLQGGFWSSSFGACACPGDMNGDGCRDGGDIQQFTTCIVAGGACDCADIDGIPGMSAGDVALFVNGLLARASCP